MWDKYLLDNVFNNHWTICPIIMSEWDKICHHMSNIFSSKFHFVQPKMFCPVPAVPAVPTFCSPDCKHIICMTIWMDGYQIGWLVASDLEEFKIQAFKWSQVIHQRLHFSVAFKGSSNDVFNTFKGGEN